MYISISKTYQRPGEGFLLGFFTVGVGVFREGCRGDVDDDLRGCFSVGAIDLYKVSDTT